MGSIVKVVEELVKSVMSSDPVHGYPHVERVRRLALSIASNYPGVDMEVVEVAALLHDIGRNAPPTEGDHAARSARVAKVLLEALGLPAGKVELVVEAISTHSYSRGKEPVSTEAKILSDADKLDALGAVGIARVLMYSGALGRSLEDSIAHFKSKILRLPELMKTEVGREEAERRARIVREFVKALEEELGLPQLNNVR